MCTYSQLFASTIIYPHCGEAELKNYDMFLAAPAALSAFFSSIPHISMVAMAIQFTSASGKKQDQTTRALHCSVAMKGMWKAVELT